MGRWIRSARGVLFDFRLIVECFQYGLVTTRTTRWRHPFGRRPIPVALGALGNTTTHVGNRTLPVPPASWSSNRISPWKELGRSGGSQFWRNAKAGRDIDRPFNVHEVAIHRLQQLRFHRFPRNLMSPTGILMNSRFFSDVLTDSNEFQPRRIWIYRKQQRRASWNVLISLPQSGPNSGNSTGRSDQ